MYKILKSTDQGLDELELEHLEKGYWLDIVAPSVEELQEISAATKIQMDFLSAALDEEEKSRIEVEDDQILILVDIPFLRSNKDYDTLPLGIVVTEEGIATICLEPNAVTADFGTHNSKMFSTFKKTRFLFQILYKSATLYLKYIRIIIRRTDELEIHLRQSMENSELFNLLDLQKSLTYFSTSLRSNSIVLERLLRLRNATQSQHLIKVYEEEEDLLDDVIIEYKQAVEMVEMYSHILNSMMEVFASIISNNLNLVMKFLASVTIILAIPTLISGLWGMNVPVPFAENPFGFLIVLSLAACIALGTAFLLWKKRCSEVRKCLKLRKKNCSPELFSATMITKNIFTCPAERLAAKRLFACWNAAAAVRTCLLKKRHSRFIVLRCAPALILCGASVHTKS